MKISRQIRLSLVMLAAISLACSVSFDLGDSSNPTQIPPVDGPTTNPPDGPTQLPENLTLPPATALPPTPFPTESPGLYQPAGFLTIPPFEEDEVHFYNLELVNIGVRLAPNIERSFITGCLHLAGPSLGSSAAAPLAYCTTGAPVLNTNDETRTLVNIGADIMLKGAPGQTAMAFSYAEWQVDALFSWIMVGDVSTIGGVGPSLERRDEASWALAVLGVGAQDNNPLEVWYTLEPWGIGGDIVFPVRKGLWVFDPSSGTSTHILGEEWIPIGLSPDVTYAAYTAINSGLVEPGGETVIIRNLTNGAETFYSLLPGSDRGAGYAAFSPNNRWVAWMEGHGAQMSQNPDFTATVRIAPTAGGTTIDIPAAAFNNLISTSPVIWTEPVGWLDNDTLLVQVRDSDGGQTGIAAVRSDGSIVGMLVLDLFMGFFYP